MSPEFAGIPIGAGLAFIISSSMGISIHHTLSKLLDDDAKDPTESLFVGLVITLTLGIFVLLGGVALFFI